MTEPMEPAIARIPVIPSAIVMALFGFASAAYPQLGIGDYGVTASSPDMPRPYQTFFDVPFRYDGVITGVGQVNFVLVTPSSGPPGTSVAIGLNPHVVPFLPPGGYSVFVQFALESGMRPSRGGFVNLRVLPPPPTIDRLDRQLGDPSRSGKSRQSSIDFRLQHRDPARQRDSRRCRPLPVRAWPFHGYLQRDCGSAPLCEQQPDQRHRTVRGDWAKRRGCGRHPSPAILAAVQASFDRLRSGNLRGNADGSGTRRNP